ncbi:glycosyltransferase family 39 protein [Leptolyngbya sp. NIES-2104]|uniref:glycosyltransferase family 39 protein n=1 Tax=Leptolyngbya sp. NIES-2104 TaxID=1552121 RepID=UPI0006ECC83C|nr:glycosyltransferase family 39 protein [Leptolyngbya sp. NIES-2104]GAP94265.1 dolichyl-phosphate-mannose-protein mannosyltransferase family [Leptolyngbya sp. NIES-2104]
MLGQLKQFHNRDFAFLGCLAGVKLLLHLFTNGQYGYFADELYYMAAGEHLAWGFAEFPPLIAVMANLSRGMLGDSLFAIRLFPAIAGALTVFLTGMMVRELGGGRFAQCFAAIAVILAPGYLFMQTILTMNAFEPLLWMLCAYVAILILKYENPKLWLIAGFVVGIGLMNKFSMALFAFSLLVGFLITPARRLLLNRWLWLGCAIALLICLPTILWQSQHSWAFLEHQRESNLYEKKGLLQSAIDLFVQQIILMNPLAFPIWSAGVYYYLFAREGRKYRAFGWTFVVILGLFLLFEARYYYLLPIYPLFLAAGAIVFEQHCQHRNLLKSAFLALLMSGGLFLAPIGLPILSIETLIRYSNAIYRPPTLSKESINQAEQAPWHFRAMLGWEKTVATVAAVYDRFAPNDRSDFAILTWRYSDAGAIDFWGRNYNLPKAISGHTGYYFWGSREYSGKLVLSVGGNLSFLSPRFDSVEQVATITHEKTVGIKSNVPIYLCRGIKKPLKESWSDFKFYFKRPT